MRLPQATLSRRRTLTGVLLVTPALAIVTIFFLIPLGLMIWMSLHKWPLLGHPSWSGLSNYSAMAGDPTFLHALGFTAKYTAIVTAALLAIGFALALLVRVPRPGVGVFRTIYFMPYVIGFAAASYLWLWLLDPGVGLLDRGLQDAGVASKPILWMATPSRALLAVIVVVVWKVVGFTMLLLMSGLQGIPDEVQEAARVDGAGRVATLRRIVLPLMRRHIALVTILAVAGSFLAFDQFYILTNGGPNNQTLTLVYWIYSSSFANFQLGYGAAMSVVLMAILMVITALQLYLLRDETEL